MKKRIAEKWVRELRSGRYRQGRNALKYRSKTGVTRHCCLGVLCEVYQREHKVRLKTRRSKCKPDEDMPRDCTVCFFDEMWGSLPKRVMKWAGVGSDDGFFSGDSVLHERENSTLAELNDDGCPFREIANVIEKRWEGI